MVAADQSQSNTMSFFFFGFISEGPQVIVDIRWDKRNESDGSYSANVTISNYFKDSELIRRWRLAWLWGSKETLLSTFGVKGTQHGSVFLGEDDYAYCLNNVTFAGDNCIDGVVPLRLRKADIIARRSTSFQITVSYSDRGEHAPPDVGLEYEHECDGWDIGYEHECDEWEIGYEYEHEFDTGEGATNDRSKSSVLLEHPILHYMPTSFVSFYDHFMSIFFGRYMEDDLRSLHSRS